MRRIPAWLVPTALMAASAVPVLAQENEPKTLSALLRLPYLGMWIAAALACYVIFTVGVTVLFQKANYPPVVARVGWWLGALFFTLFVVFYLINYVLKIVLPWYALLMIFILLLLAGLVLVATRPRTA